MAILSVNPYVIDVEEFSAWLLARPSDAIVGTSCDDLACPLARFLNEQYQGSTFAVHTCDYERLMDDVSLGVEPEAIFQLPEWAQDFTHLVDSWNSFNDVAPVSASEASWYLALVCEMYGLVLSEVCNG